MPRNLFAEDFDSREAVSDEVPPQLAAPETSREVVSLAEHNSKCVRAWAEGQQAGVAAARADQRAKALATFVGLEQAIGAMHDEWLAEARAVAEALAGLLCASLATAFPTLCANHGAAEVRAIVKEILPELAHEPEVMLRIAPVQATTVTTLLDGAGRADTRVRVMADAEMTEGDFRLEWSRGEARRDTHDIWVRIETILALQGLMPPRAATAEQEKEAAHVD